MGFRNEAWMKVWDVKPTKSPKIMQIRGTTSVRKKDVDGTPLDEWETDFSGFCSCIGTAAEKVSKISPIPDKDHPASIHLKAVEVKSPSVLVNGEWKNYTNFNIYDFDFGEGNVVNNQPQPVSRPSIPNPTEVAYEGVTDDLEEGLPF